MEIVCVFFGQLLITNADMVVRRRGVPALLPYWRFWLLRYLPARLGGLILRLYALLHLPVGVAATLFAGGAVSFSAVAAAIHGEGLVRREWAAVGLVALAIAVRGLA